MSIFCSRCGTQQQPNAEICPSCGATILRPLQTPHQVQQDANSKLKNIAMAAACGLYLVYPSFGLFELIPDALPLVGSLDEATATAGLLYALSNLGWIPWQRKS